MDQQQIEELVNEVQQDLDFLNTRLTFKVDNESKETVVQVLDKETGDVLKQIPPENLLKIRTAFREFIKGVLFEAQA